MRKFVKENSLSLTFLALFVAALVLQAIAGHADFNEDQVRHGDPTMSLGRYVVSSEFGTAVLENWQSEYLQFTLFILLTVWLLQRGSPESKELGKVGRESDEDAAGRPPRGRELAALGSCRRPAAHALRELAADRDGRDLARPAGSRSRSRESTSTTPSDSTTTSCRSPGSTYLGKPDFWEKTLQNWQSEFLAVGSMAILAVYLSQRGSPESKPVGAPHDATGIEG